jgi:hypothetical protein
MITGESVSLQHEWTKDPLVQHFKLCYIRMLCLQPRRSPKSWFSKIRRKESKRRRK